MQTPYTKFLLCAVLICCSLCVIAQPRLPAGYFWKKLPNGLEVVVIENSKVPLATIEIAVKNGAYTEGPEYSGLSHFFEHMFFKANKDYPTQEKFLKRTQELGAIWNGTTDVERVNYYFTFEKDSLKAGLQFMNSAIRYPLYQEEEMRKERLVVDGEFQRNESDPGFELYFEMLKRLWGDQITRKNAIGIHEVINTATPEQMTAIKNRYYYPNNSLLTICGDVKHEAAFKLAESVLGDWKSSGFDPEKKYPIPPFKPLTRNAFFIRKSSIAQTPDIAIAWHGPSYLTDSASTVAADVFSTIVGLNSSKLQQALVDKGLASNVYLAYTTSRFIGPVNMSVSPNPNRLKECFNELMHQINLWENPDYYTDEQLRNAKAIMMRNSIRSKEKPSDLPAQLSYQWCSTSLNYFTDIENSYQQVTRADIKRFLDKYINDKYKVAGLIISPDQAKEFEADTFFKDGK